MADHGATMFLMASTLFFAAPFVAVTAAAARDAPASAPGGATAPEPAPADTPGPGVSIHPFVANALDRRDVARTVEMGEPGGDTYVERVPRAFGLTLHAPL
jgi:hypothetical protein